MTTFHYQDHSLFVEDLPLNQVAEQFGTPCFVYSRAALQQSYLAYENAFSDSDHLVCYAVKANSNLAVLGVLAKLGAGFDIVSGGELERVLRAGGDPARTASSTSARILLGHAGVEVVAVARCVLPSADPRVRRDRR